MDKVEQSSMDAFIQSLDAKLRSGDGVVVVRTDEPARAVYGIGQLVGTYNFPKAGYLSWSMSKGVVEVPSEKCVMEERNVPMNVLNAFVSTDTNTPLGGHSVLIMRWMHHFTAKLPPLCDLLSDLYVELPSTGVTAMGKRLILLMPLDWEPEQGMSMIRMVDLKPPTQVEMEDTLLSVIQGSLSEANRNRLPVYDDEDISKIAEAALGLNESGAEAAFSEIMYQNKVNIDELTASKFAGLLSKLKASAVNNIEALSMEEPLDPSMVAGFDLLNNDMDEWVSSSDEAGSKANIRPKGMLLIGPPGTGKSYVARSIAARFGWPMIELNLGALKDKYVGGTGAKARAAFAMINSIGSAVVFVDEVDKSVGDSPNETGGSSGDLLKTLLNEMENNDKIITVFTANRIGSIPPELTREGRLDTKYFVDLPNRRDRLAMLEVQISSRGMDVPDDLELTADVSEGFSAAELDGAVKRTARRNKHQTGEIYVTGEDLVTIMSTMRTLSSTMADKVNEMRAWGNEFADHVASDDVDAKVVEMAPRRRRTRQIN